METASIIARMEGLERRLASLEDMELARVDQFSAIERQLATLMQIRGQSPRSSPNRMKRNVVTPPGTRGGAAAHGAWVRSDSTSTSIDEISAPRTPPPTRPFADPSPVIMDDTEGDEPVEDLTERLFRHSQVTKGHDESIQKIVSVLAAEHNARVGLQADVATLREMLATVQEDLLDGRKPRIVPQAAGWETSVTRPGPYSPQGGMPWDQLRSRFSSDSSFTGFASAYGGEGSRPLTTVAPSETNMDDETTPTKQTPESLPDEHEEYRTPPMHPGSEFWPQPLSIASVGAQTRS